MWYEPRVALAMIAKMPRPNECKTRLVPPLTHEQAAVLSARFIADTAAHIRTVAAACDATPAVLYLGESTPEQRDAVFGRGMTYIAQRGETFGERIASGVVDFLAAGFCGVNIIDSDSPTLPSAYLDTVARALAVPIDSDSPTLPSAYLDTVARALAVPGDRVVLGPAEDGGYYLIGVNAVHPELFESIDWSTDRVFAQTLARARSIPLEIVTLPPWYDVDDADSLAMLRREFDSGVPPGGYAAEYSCAYLAAMVDSGHEVLSV